MQNQTSSSLNSTSLPTANLVSSSLMGLFFIVGITGNIAIIVFILRYFKRDNFTIHLMLNLAVSDILCLITLPGWIYSDLNSIGWGTCMFFTTLVYCSMYSSVITVSVLSVYRCLKVRHPQMWSIWIDRRKENALLFTSWVLALVFTCPGVLTQEITESKSKTECEKNLDSRGTVIVAAMESLFGFVLPLTIILTSYYYLQKIMTQRLKKHKQKLTKLVTRIIVMFLVCWAPQHIMKMVEIFAIFLHAQLDVSNIRNIVGCLAFFHSCVNPFLYAFSSKTLRQQKQLTGGPRQDSAQRL